ncbi:MAG: hypothetical protein IKA83_07000 [Paludibacteraceae bacterium]|nr:hypothetical protein [Paludibacteraceae bacterium]
MKKFIYILIALLTISAIAVAQIKMQVWLNDDEPAIFDYNQILKVGFVGESLPDTPSEKPEDPEDKPITPEYPEEDEFVAKLFSVSATKTVTFSPGNLQYHPANNEWRFAQNQTDYIGEDNANISSSYNGWIDLFGWGTGNNPTNASTDDNDYQTFVDWGVNQIGSYAPNTWRTLTHNEWYYLCYERPNYDKLIGVAQVNGVNGLILLPDGWTCPSGVTFKSGFHDDYNIEYYAEYQTFSSSEWTKLENSGAVFLPAAGYRYGSNLYYVQNYGYYWSATEGYSNGAYSLNFGSEGASMGDVSRQSGHSVRLVQDVATDPDDDPVVPPVKPDDGDDDIDTPEVELPGEGKIRFIVDATAVDACYGVGFVGQFCNWDPNLTFQGTEFAENMFYIDIPSMTAEEFGNAKILLLNEDGTSSWGYEVSYNGYDITASEDYITLVDDSGTLNAINLVADNIDNVVIKIAILEVESNPCKPVLAGYAKFVLTVKGDIPDGKKVIFTGNFGAGNEEWGASTREMTKQADGTYVWEGAYPENFQFKAFIADCEDLGFGEDDYGYIYSELWLEGANRLVELGSGSVIEFEGCFEFLCPEDDEIVEPEKPTLPLYPTVSGTEGKYTIAFKVPETSDCDPVINFFGAFQDYNIADANAPVAEKINEAGFENWYKLVFTSSDPYNACGKLCPQIGETPTWEAQGTYNPLQGDVVITEDYGTQNKIVCGEEALGAVVYIEVLQWDADPCMKRNIAGPASYELIIKTQFPANLDPATDLTVTATVGWATDAMSMYYDPSYTGEGLRFIGMAVNCPANETYKYVLKYKDSTEWIYENGDAHYMPYGNQAKDEVIEWESQPWNENN